MRIEFTKMHGLGNDFIVFDRAPGAMLPRADDWRRLSDRRTGIGFDQAIVLEPPRSAGTDVYYRIFNADGEEVEQCGNGARCFVRFVREQGLTTKDAVKVQTLGGVIEPRMDADGRVTVDMGAPIFEPARVPFDAAGLTAEAAGSWQKWPLVLDAPSLSAIVSVAVLSMGNPHAVQLVDDVDTAPVAVQGPLIERHAAFPKRVNAGFMQVLGRGHIRLRVYERGAGETLACGTGACAAVVAGIRLGLLDARVDVDTRGGRLTIEWAGGYSPVLMTGPAVTVFAGDIDIPDHP
jgi:diaminopimelate epimerase